jgi:hypothetical protein
VSIHEDDDGALILPAAAVVSGDAAVPTRLRALAWLLDEVVPIPGTRVRVGLDAVAGLAPGVGDTLTGLLSAYVVVEAARMGISTPVLLRMVTNVAADTLLGAIPVAGDLFDAGFRSNSRNLALLRAELERPGSELRPSVAVVAGVALALLLVLVGFGFIAFWIARTVWHVLTG